MHFPVQLSYKCWVCSSPYIEYQGAIAGIMHDVRNRPPPAFCWIQCCRGILPNYIMSCYIFMNMRDWAEDVLLEHRAWASRKVRQKWLSGMHEDVPTSGLMVGWHGVGIYKLSVDERRIMRNLASMCVIQILRCSSNACWDKKSCVYHRCVFARRSGRRTVPESAQYVQFFHYR